ncbi:MAG: TetR/AcrR family transcriptional regulator [Bacillota bacterium]
MDSKKRLIIKTATKFFSEKGYYSTSVQEIAEQCAMSKGSLYKLFSSKEDLFIEVFEYYQNIMFEKASSYSFDTSLSPKELLIKQIRLQIEDFIDKKEFILMQLKEMPINGNDKLKILMKRMRARLMNWQKNCLIQAYGKDIEPYLWDLTIQIQGVIKEYISILFNEKSQEDIEAIAIFVVDRLDSIINDLMKNNPTPLLTDEMMSRYLNFKDSPPSKTEDIRIHLKLLEENINSLIDEKLRENLSSSLAMIKDELKSSQPRLFLLDALLHYFEKEKQLSLPANKLRSLLI